MERLGLALRLREEVLGRIPLLRRVEELLGRVARGAVVLRVEPALELLERELRALGVVLGRTVVRLRSIRELEELLLAAAEDRVDDPERAERTRSAPDEVVPARLLRGAEDLALAGVVVAVNLVLLL
ncbi:MAG: hypothetical protein AAFU03_06770, partial [Bacteroidota bacterium]